MATVFRQPENAWVQAPTLRKSFIFMEYSIFLIPSSRYHFIHKKQNISGSLKISNYLNLNNIF
ncbi:hypothetical protein [Alysiella crassa]|uniref:hypothetical protein n=1 Tax=Alysiella crassa TaxID=153491 RepID=UPI0011C02662|nr:hypothetical protein [Alysiella crassa]UOP05921.1 hypothetical protein LVJ80_08520 [Alysiella crassa]